MIKLSDHLYIPPMGRVIEDRRRARAEGAKRTNKRYAAANAGRVHSGWLTQPESANWALLMGTKILRARARQMCGDVPHFKKYLTMCRSNIIGQSGLQLQCRARNARGALKADLNKKVEMAFYKWGFAETCTVSGKLDWLGAQRLFVKQLARDGEVLVQKVRPKGNPFGFALKFIDVSYLDEGYNETLPNGNRIIMSVEIDNDNRPVAYHLTPPSTEWGFIGRRQRTDTVRVPASEFIHAFFNPEDESQVRGLTWLHAVLLGGKSLDNYVESVVIGSRVGVMNLGFIEETATDPENKQYDGEEDPETGVAKDVEINFYPGAFTTLGPGQKVSSWKPELPPQNHSEFKKSMESDQATGVDLHYFSLFGDMEAVNYSSARWGSGEERDIWRELQDFVGTAFCREVYHAWLEAAWLNERLMITSKEYDEVKNPYWNGRGWPYIDPQKEVKAALDAIEGGILTKTAHFASQGIDINDWLEEKRQEMELFEKAGVEYAPPPKQLGAAPAPDDDDDDEPTPKEKKKKRELAATNGNGKGHY